MVSVVKMKDGAGVDTSVQETREGRVFVGGTGVGSRPRGDCRESFARRPGLRVDGSSRRPRAPESRVSASSRPATPETLSRDHNYLSGRPGRGTKTTCRSVHTLHSPFVSAAESRTRMCGLAAPNPSSQYVVVTPDHPKKSE